MSFKIGFSAESPHENADKVYAERMDENQVRRSVAEVYFPDRNRSYSYYNDKFDLHVGSLVYVDGKLEGLRGRVTKISYNFKIDLSVYKRIIYVVCDNIHGEFYAAGSHLVTFDRNALTPAEADSWFLKPKKEDVVSEIVTGFDDAVFCIDNLNQLDINSKTSDIGHDLYWENKVKYISVEGKNGYALVGDEECCRIEFEYKNRQVSKLVCSCFATGHCKHVFAAMLQLAETLNIISDKYGEFYDRTNCFHAVERGAFIDFAVVPKTEGSIIV